MKTTTRMLANEHDLLERVASCMDDLLARAVARDELEAEAMARLLAFFEDQVDGLHQDKEERVLFPCLLRRAPRAVAEELEGLFAGHREERERLDVMRSSFEGAAYGDPFSLDRFVTAARAYLALQREHLQAENRWLLPRVDELLTEADDRRLTAGFRGLERVRGRAFVPTAEDLLAALEARPLRRTLGRRAG